MSTLTMIRGDDVVLDVTATDAGEPVDLTGADLWWTAKSRHIDPDDKAVIRKTVGQGITVTDAAGGLAEVAILPADTESLVGSAALFWDLQVKDGAGHVRTLAKGRLMVNADVTRATA